MDISNITKFNWREIFSNNNGKTSGSGFAGVLSVMTGLIGFVSGLAMYWFLGVSSGADNVLLQSLGMVTLGTVLLGARKLSKDGNMPLHRNEVTDNATTDNTTTDNASTDTTSDVTVSDDQTQQLNS
ncbi:MAG: hypothetical protein WC979_01705 [Candidatus Pacearchaeota archaeon]|jgi:hypothetical protein|nr:hypothetical protein [Clostridia bacterium]